MRKVLIARVLLTTMLLMALVMVGSVSAITSGNNNLPPHQMTPLVPEKELHPTPPLPESELTHIIFSKAWFVENDEDKHPDLVKITFPTSWLNKSPNVSNNEPIVLLRIPKEMLRILDTNKDPNWITVTLPEDRFEYYQNISELKKIKEEKASIENKGSVFSRGMTDLSASNDNSYGEWYWFACDPFSDNPSHVVTGLTGLIDPYSYYNSGEKFTSYHERETYLTGENNIIEFISAFYGETGKIYVWVALYDGSSSYNLLSIDVTDSLQPIEYYFFIDQGYYKIWLKDTKTGNWYYRAYDDRDDPGTRITWLAGSTELYTSNSISKDFKVVTYPLTTDWVWYDGSYHRPNEAFEDWGKSSNQPYVYVDGWFDSSGKIITKHRSANDEP